MQMSNRMAGMKSALTSRVSVPAARWPGAQVGAGRGDPSAAIAWGNDWRAGAGGSASQAPGKQTGSTSRDQEEQVQTWRANARRQEATRQEGVRIRDAAGLGRGMVDAWKGGGVKLTAMMLRDRDGCARRAENKDIVIAVREWRREMGRKDGIKAEETASRGEGGGGERSEKQMDTKGRRKDVTDGKAGGTRLMGVEKRKPAVYRPVRVTFPTRRCNPRERRGMQASLHPEGRGAGKLVDHGGGQWVRRARPQEHRPHGNS